jgi:hypothetical protein
MLGKATSLVLLCGAAAHEGGRPPRPADPKLCDIAGLFAHLERITNSEDCRAGCAGGVCPEEWYPGVEDSCESACAKIYEPFWDECGAMMEGMGMGGMETMGAFYDDCLETLYPPGKCGIFCNEHTYECMLDETHEACCDEEGSNCVDSSDVPLTCPVGCALVWPEFAAVCKDHIEAQGGLTADYEKFTEECLAVDGIALVEYALELKKKGCTIDLEGAAGGRRQLQRSVSGGMLEQWLDSDDYGCVWEEIDDGANAVDDVCCGENGQLCTEEGDSGFASPATCSMTCLIATHEFTTQCGETLAHILGPERSALVSGFEERCVGSVDTEAFVMAIQNAVCPDASGVLPPPPPPFAPPPAPAGGPCDLAPCKNGGGCASSLRASDPMGTVGYAICTCAPGFQGETCTEPFEPEPPPPPPAGDACDPNPCANGGGCSSDSM